MKKIIDYKVLHEYAYLRTGKSDTHVINEAYNELRRRIIYHSKKGYQLLGGISTVMTENGKLYVAQAVVKYE